MQSFSDCRSWWSKEPQWTNNCGSFLPCFLLVWVKWDCKIQSKLETLDALMRASSCGLPMENVDWVRVSTLGSRPKTGGLCLWSWENDEVHNDYVGHLNNLSASFYCMYFLNIVRHHVIFVFNTKQPISILTFFSFFFFSFFFG